MWRFDPFTKIKSSPKVDHIIPTCLFGEYIKIDLFYQDFF